MIQDISVGNPFTPLGTGVYIFLFIFYLLAITLAFLAYREYKGMVFDSTGSASNSWMFPQGGGVNAGYAPPSNQNIPSGGVD